MDAHRAAQSMNRMYRGTPLPLLMAAMGKIHTLNVPAEINIDVRPLCFLVISQFVSNWELMTKTIRQCISWIIERM